MKFKWFIHMTMLGLCLCRPSIVFAKEFSDSVILDRVYSYQRNFVAEPKGDEHNVYMKFVFHTLRRNITMKAIPSLYHISKGNRDFVGEAYGKIKFNGIKDYKLTRQVEISTIPHYYITMPIMLNYLVPDLYGVTLFQDYMLSPFNKNNKNLYRYFLSDMEGEKYLLSFLPKIRNTQLVRGFAVVDGKTGRIINTHLNGEYDMIKFDINATMESSLIPQKCITDAEFNFIGNKVRTRFTAYYDQSTTLPDSISKSRDSEIIYNLRPTLLEKDEETIYMDYYNKIAKRDSMRITDSISGTTTSGNRKIAWDVLGDHIFNRTKVTSQNVSLRLSPILNPLYFGYSGRKGFSYKMKIGVEYRFDKRSNISLNPKFGYNFKIKQFYFDLPLRYTINKDRDAWVQLSFANGNRITNSTVMDMIKSENVSLRGLEELNLDYFKDTHFNLSTNMELCKQIEMTLTLLYYRRSAVNKTAMLEAGQLTKYYSFSPAATIKYQPSHRWPIFSVYYERSDENIFNSNTKYEKWELDVSYKLRLTSLRKVNARIGGGVYSNQSKNYFVDFVNFHENYLQGGWDDDWTGDFQLINRHWYNASKYYFRTNFSYESPLLLLSWMPLVGKMLETERVYLNYVQLAHTRPYYEIGYGFTTRYISVGLFSSFLNTEIQDIGFKFTLELFRKW